MNVARNNKIFYIIASALRGAALLCASGPLMQTLIEVLGLSSKLNYIHTTLLQIVNVLTTVICSRWADKGSIMKRMMLVQIPYSLLFLFYIPVCVLNNASFEVFLLLLVVGMFQTVTIALSTVCAYKLPYFIFDPDEYGPIEAVSGIVSGVVSIGLSSLISGLTNYVEYNKLMIFAFIVSAVFAAASGIMYSLQKPLDDTDSNQSPKGREKVSLIQVLAHPVFYKLSLANLFRGFATGTTGVLAIVAFEMGFNESITTVMVPLTSAAMFAGCIILGIALRYISPRVLVFIGSLAFLLMPLLFVPNGMIFLTIYTVILLGRNIVDYSVPAALLKAVPVKIAGPYNAWRMILHSVGTLIATSVASVISPSVLFAITIAAQMISGLSFLRLKELRKS